MQELRLVAVSEDGTYLVLATAGRGTRFTLPVDDRLRAAVRGHFSRLGQFEIEVESPLRPKEIQARIRAGETAEEIAESAGIPVERVRWFEGPVLQEREYMAQQAQRVAVRRPGESSPGPPLGEMVEERLNRGGVDLEDVEWDSWKCEDSTWRVRLSFFDDGRPHAAEWIFDPRRRHLSPLDEVAARLSSLDWDASSAAGSGDTVTPLLSRRPAMKVVQDPRESTPPDRASESEPRREYIVERGRMVDARPQATAREAAAGAPSAPQIQKPTAPSREAASRPAEPTAAEQMAAERAVERHAATERAATERVAAERAAAERAAEESAAKEAAEERAATERAQAEAASEQRAATERAAAERTAAERAAAKRTESARTEAARAAEKRGTSRRAGSGRTAVGPAAAERAAAGREAERESEVTEPRKAAKPAQPKERPARREPRSKPADAPSQPEEQVAEPAAAAAGGEVPVPAQQRQPAERNRRKSKGKRASVPSWDEIMFGARRPD